MRAIARNGCTNTITESALKVDWRKNPLLHQGIDPKSHLRPALLFDPMLYQLSCPNPFQGPATRTVLSSTVQEQNRVQKFIQFSSVQDGICVLEKAQTCTPPCISEVSVLPLKQAQYLSD